LLNELIDRVARWRGYQSPEEVGKAIEEAKASVAVPDSLISSVMTAMTTGISPEKSWGQLVDSYRSWVYTAIDKIGKTVGSRNMHLFVYRRKSGEKIIDSMAIHLKIMALDTEKERAYALKEMGIEKQEVFDHPFLSLMHRPNGIMSRMVLWYETILRMELGGLCAWYMPPNGLKLPGEIWPLPLQKTATISPRVNAQLQIEEWIYRDGTVNNRYAPQDILTMKYPNPASPFLGFSPLMAQTYPYDIDLFLMQQQRALFQNKGIPGIHLHTDQPLTREQALELRTQVMEQFGAAAQSGRPMVTHSGLAAEKTGWSNRDSMFGDVSKWSREKLITSYDLSEGKLGLEVPSNRANMEVLDETFEKECIIPKCMLIEEQINTFLLPRYDRGLVAEFERMDIGDREFDMRETEMELRTFVTVINEVRARKGKPPVPWGDKPWIPFGLSQDPEAVSEPTPPAEPPPAKEDGEPEEKGSAASRVRNWRRFISRQTPWEKMVTSQMKGYFRNLGSEVVGRLNKLGPRVEAQYAGWSRKAVQEHIAKKGVGDDINIDKKAEIARLRLLVKPPVTALVEEGGKRILREIGVNFAFDVNDPKVAKWLGSRMDMFSTEVAGTTFDDIRAVLRQGFSDGKPLSVIADTLRETFDSYDKYRAPLIARTETIAASNKADLLAIRQAGIEEKVVKTWLTAGDENVRPTHQQAGEQYADGIPIGDLFQVGDDEMDAPGNGSDPAETINCRCALGYEKA
jgi:phage portal protein BeeE